MTTKDNVVAVQLTPEQLGRFNVLLKELSERSFFGIELPKSHVLRAIFDRGCASLENEIRK